MINLIRVLSLFIIFILTSCETTKIADKARYNQALLQSFHKSQTQQSYKKIKVALLLPLSGSHKNLGINMLQAAQLSLFENANNRLELVIRDTKGTPDGTLEAIHSIIHDDIKFVVGPLLSSCTKSIIPTVNKLKIPMITFSTNLSLILDGIIVFGWDIVEQLNRILVYIKRENIKNIAAVLPNSQYGQILEKELKEISLSNKISLKKVIFYEYNSNNLSSIAESLSKMDIQGIFFPEGGNVLSLFISSLRYYDVDLDQTKLIGIGQWDTNEIKKTKAIGSWFVSTPIDTRYHIERKFIENFETTLKRPSTLSFDAILLISELVKRNPNFSYRELIDPKGFFGLNGIFRILPSGITERGLAIYELTNYGIRTISAAPRKF